MPIREANKRLFWGLGITCAAASLYPISILISLGADGIRWVQNDPAYSFFVLLILPLTVGIFTRTFNLQILFTHAPRQRMILFGLLVIMEAFAAFLAAQEAFRGPVVAPFMLKEPGAAMTLDRCLRDCMHAIRADEQEGCAQNGCPQVVSELLTDTGEGTREKALRIYRESGLGRPFDTYRDFFSRGGVTAYVSSFFDIFSGLFVMLVLWYIMVLVTSKGPREPGTSDALIVVYGLLLIWFPTRVYSEWYINYYSIAHFSEYFAFWFLLGVALLTIPLLVLMLKPGRPVLILTTLNGVVLALLGLINHFRPEWVRAIANSLESMPFPYFVAFALLIFVVLATMVFAMLPIRASSAKKNSTK